MTVNNEDFAPVVGTNVNVADFLAWQVEKRPFQKAVILPAKLQKDGAMAYSHLTYLQLEALVDRYAHALSNIGVSREMRVIIGIRPGFDLVAVTFALFKLGAVPVFIDPGMGKEGFLKCIDKANAEAMIGEFKLHVASMIYGKYFTSIKKYINVGSLSLGKIKSLRKLPYLTEGFPIAETTDTDPAAILFTSGSTGTAKGACYTHGTFIHQIKIIREAYNITSKDVDMSIFPLFALFAVAMGMTTVIPDMDASKPVQADPIKICRTILDQGVTFSFGSPTFWNRISDFCLEHELELPTLRALLMAGCSVPAKLHAKFLDHLLKNNGDIYVPYGATEALPLTTFCGSEVLSETAGLTDEGKGTCVGKAVSPKNIIKIIEVSDDPISDWKESLEQPVGKIGEICARGLTVTCEYFNEPSANEKSKIKQGRYIWHRMGDLGYFDEDGKLWFCGRKVDRIKTAHGELYTDQTENVFNCHDAVYRTALVGIPAQNDESHAVIFVEPNDRSIIGTPQGDSVLKDLYEMAKNVPLTENVSHFIFKDHFPVDVRHNAKIKREILTEWAKSNTDKITKFS